jgi:putative restriction endonuclease
VLARTKPRIGQNVFRYRLLDAYGRRCAVTGERTEPVLDAAHVQPYLGPRSNHLQNGLLLTKEFHTLFDLGYATVTPDYRLRVSRALRDEWQNGKRYYAFDGKEILLPKQPEMRPSQAALEWHGAHTFRG